MHGQGPLLEVTLDDDDPVLSERLKAIPTSLELPPGDVELLRAHARRRLRAAPEYRAMLGSLQSSPAHEVVP